MAESIQYIKISRTDARDVDITPTLETLTTIIIPSASVNLKYKVNNSSKFQDYYLYQVIPPNNDNLSTGITSSIQYDVLTTLPSFVNVIGVGFFDKPAPISLGTINQDPLNLLSTFINTSLNNTSTTYFSPPSDLQDQNDVHIRITAQASLDAVGPPAGYGVIEIVKGTFDDIVPGTGSPIGSNVFVYPDTTFTIDISANTTINFGEVIYARIREIGAGFNSTVLSLSNSSVQISSSIFSGSDEPTLVLEPFLQSQFAGSDCDVLAGNASQPVANPFLQDIDYSKGSITPVNNIAIISGSATRGTVPESYYTSLSSVNLKYNGSKIQSSNFNIFTSSLQGNITTTDFGNPINIGTYGKTSPIEVSSNYVIYYKSSTGNKYGGSFGTLFQTFDLSYIITPGGELIEITNEQTLFEQLQQSFMPTPLPNILPAGSPVGPVSFKALSFATGSSFVGEYTGVSRVYTEELDGSVKLDLYSNILGGIVPLVPSLNPQITGSGGLIFATSIEYSEIPDLPSRAREILTKNNIIPPSN